MDHLLVLDDQNIIIGILDHITQPRAPLASGVFKSLLPAHDPAVWAIEFPERQILFITFFFEKRCCIVYWGDDTTIDEYGAEKDAITLSHLFEKGTYKIFIFANTEDTFSSS